MANDEFASLSPCIRGILILMWFSLGITYTMPGPTLLFLACRIRTTVQSFVLLLLGRSVAALAGGLVVTMVKRYINPLSQLFCGLIVLSVSTSLIPFVNTFEMMGFTLMCTGLGYGASWEAGNFIVQNSEWKRVNIQFLLFGVGALVAPLCSEQFPLKDSLFQASRVNMNTKNSSVAMVTTISCTSRVTELTGIYLTGSIPLYLLIIIALGVLIYRVNIPTRVDSIPSQGSAKDVSQVWNITYCGYFSAVNGIAVAIESVIAILVVLYATTSGIPLSKALLINSAFWISYCTGCCVVPVLDPLTQCARSSQLVSSIKLVGAIIGSVVMTTSSQMTPLLFGLILIGLCLPCLTESISTLNENHSLWIRYQQQFIFISRFIAEALAPYATVSIMDDAGRQSFPFAILGLCLLLAVLYIPMTFIGQRRQRDLQVSQYEDIELDYRFERKAIRSKMRNEVNNLLGDPYDDLSYYTSDDEVLFDKNRSR